MRKQETKRLSIDLPVTMHKQLKTLAAMRDTSVKSMVVECLIDHLKIPNSETIKAMEEVDQGQNLLSCHDIEDFFEQMDCVNDTEDQLPQQVQKGLPPPNEEGKI